MCIIVYKPENVKMPDYETLKNCFNNNEDGAGYMFAHNGKVHIIKGLMFFGGFIKSLNHTVAKYGSDRAYVLHFRWSTQGGVRRDCTHPFPLSKNMNDLRKLKTECDIGIAHNGIIDLTTSYQKFLTYSDTMEFITEYLSLIIKGPLYYKNADKLKLIEKLTDSKLAILDGQGHCELLGGKWTEDRGVFYSNDSYLPSMLYPCHGSFFDDDGCCRTGGYSGRLSTYERYYDPAAGHYDFVGGSCPVFEDEDFRYCPHCKDYGACYSEIETNKNIKNIEEGF